MELGARTAWGMAAAACGILATVIIAKVIDNGTRISKLETADAVHRSEHSRIEGQPNKQP